MQETRAQDAHDASGPRDTRVCVVRCRRRAAEGKLHCGLFTVTRVISTSLCTEPV